MNKTTVKYAIGIVAILASCTFTFLVINSTMGWVKKEIEDTFTAQQVVEYSLKDNNYDISTVIWYNYYDSTNNIEKDIVASQYAYLDNNRELVDKVKKDQISWALDRILILQERLDNVDPDARIGVLDLRWRPIHNPTQR